MLSGQCINKTLGGREILKDVSIEISPGRVSCLIGPSGSGKTTLLRALALIDLPDRGQVIIDGREYTFPRKKAKETLAPWPIVTAVFQTLFLWPHLTLLENIALPCRNIQGIDANKEIESLIDFFEMSPFIKRFPNQASLGERQRVALARALILKPRYLLLDEITSALDIEQTARILNYLQTLRGLETGMLVITHAIGFAHRVCDHVYFMDQGSIVEHGGSEIIDSPQTERFAQFLSAVKAAW